MKFFATILFVLFLSPFGGGVGGDWFVMLSGVEASAQPRLILNNNIYMVLKNNIELVINNSAANAITTLGTGGNIISESEFNRVKWNIGTATGIYTVPFTKSLTIHYKYHYSRSWYRQYPVFYLQWKYLG